MRVSSNSQMTDAQSKVFGAEMRRLRKDAEMSTTEFAKYVGATPTHISNLELASRKPSPQLAERIANAFDMDVADMLTPHREKIAEERREYGRKITQARVKKGFSVSLMAGALGIPPTVYKEYEQGACSVCERHAETINSLLGIGEEEKETTPIEVKKAVEIEDNTPSEVCDIILEHITDLKVDKDTQKKVWLYFSNLKLDAEARRLFG